MLKAMLGTLKSTLQCRLRSQGIDIRKAPTCFAPIPVFQLAVEALIARRGQALNFVQVGANDGLFGDPLRPYVLSHGWRGVLVEPQPNVFEKLKVNYANCADRLVFENLAISRESSLTLYLPPLPSEGAITVYAESVVSSDATVISRQLGLSENKLRKIVVPAMTLDALFAKYGIRELDLLQIDAEGYDWEVLQTLTFQSVKPTLIQLETGHMSRKQLLVMAKTLNKEGYLIWYGGLQADTLAMRREFFLN